MKSTVPYALILGALAASSVANAQDRTRQYRQLTLIDGRELTAEILSTEPTGLALLTPQGRSLLSFEDLMDMVPTDEAAYASQEHWRVVLAVPADERELWESAFTSIPALDVVPSAGGFGITPGQMSVVRGCTDGDTSCVSKALTGDTWTWVVGGVRSEDGTFKMQSRISGGGRRVQLDGVTADETALALAARDLLQLSRPTDAGSVAKGGDKTGPKPAGNGDFTRSKVVALSFVPLPGMPSLAQKDGGGFGIAMATVIPATALWVGAVGKTSQSTGETIGLSVGGFYALTVVANQALGMRSFNRVALAPMPTRGKGAGIAVAGQL